MMVNMNNYYDQADILYVTRLRSYPDKYTVKTIIENECDTRKISRITRVNIKANCNVIHKSLGNLFHQQ